MHENFPTFHPSFVNPVADRSELRFEGIDPVIANTLNVQHLDPPFALFNPKGTMSTGTFPRDEVWTRT